MRRGRFTRAALLCTVLPALLGQQETIFRTNVHVVEVSIVAAGSKAALKRELDAADFRVWDNGKEQTITSLKKVDSRLASPAESTPNTFSNRIGKPGQPQALSMILLDCLNTKFRLQAGMRRAVEKIIAQMQPGDRVAIYTFGSDLQILHNFSSDKASLLAQLAMFAGDWGIHDDLLPDLDFPPPRPPPPPMMVAEFNRVRTLDTLRIFEALAKHVIGVPGRKNMIWLTGGFPPAREWETDFQRATSALNDAGVSLYPVDVRGLTINRSVNINIAFMERIADDTGGMAYVNRNDLDRGVRLALEDSRDIYMLTYSPETIASDGAFHHIKLRTTRSGVELRYRRGYFAPGRQEAPSAPAEDRMKSVLSSPLDASEIGIRAGIEPDSAAGEEMSVVIRVDPADLELKPVAGRWVGALNLVAVQTDMFGDNLGGVRQVAELKLESATYQRALQEGMPFVLKLKRQAAAVSVRIGVVEESGGHTGSVSIPLPVSR